MKHLALEVRPIAGSSIEQVAEELIKLRDQLPSLLITAHCNDAYIIAGDNSTAESLEADYWRLRGILKSESKSLISK